MTKEEKIKEAWGEYYTGKVDENGWLLINSEINSSDELFDRLEINSESYLMRPKSLKSIENNKGWIKIESEKDLPKDEEMYWASNDNYVYSYCYSKSELIEDYKKDNAFFTHYQPIIKPEPPIY